MNWNKLTNSLLKALCALGVVIGLRLIFLEVSTITALFFIVVLLTFIFYTD